MPPLTAPADDLRALDEGGAAVDLSDHRTVRVHGSDARGWLHDLVTTDVASLEPGGARRSLLLDPTGHIRADVQVACDDDGFWLFQAPDQADDIAAMLAPYVLSADVKIEDLSEERSLVALPGPVDHEDGGRAQPPGGFAPSIAGDGRDLLLGAAPIDPPPGRALVDPAAFEVWRIRRGRARMGIDFDRSSIPAEAGLESTIDATKGCFLGQESVARVRNLGHPPRVLLHLEGDGPVETGSIVTVDGDDAGVVTSAAERGDGAGTVMLASIRWSARESPLRSPDGVALVPVGSSD